MTYLHDITLAFSIHSVQEEPGYQEMLTGMLNHIDDITNSAGEELNFEIFFTQPIEKTI